MCPPTQELCELQRGVHEASSALEERSSLLRSATSAYRSGEEARGREAHSRAQGEQEAVGQHCAELRGQSQRSLEELTRHLSEQQRCLDAFNEAVRGDVAHKVGWVSAFVSEQCGHLAQLQERSDAASRAQQSALEKTTASLKSFARESKEQADLRMEELVQQVGGMMRDFVRRQHDHTQAAVQEAERELDDAVSHVQHGQHELAGDLGRVINSHRGFDTTRYAIGLRGWILTCTC